MAEVKRILVLEPDDITSGSVKRMLEAEGYEVTVTTQPEEALRVLGDEGAELLVTEVSVPGKSGLDILRDVRETHPEVDVVLITPEPSMSEARESKRLGALEYIGRPFTPEFFLQTVRGAFERQGWILRKKYIEQFKQYVTAPGQMDEGTVYYKDGLWAQPSDGGLWEVGMDVRHFYLEGQLLYVEHFDVPELSKGKPFARLLVGEGTVRELMAPMDGRVVERNPQVNDAMCNLARECLTESWMLWLVRIETTGA